MAAKTYKKFIEAFCKGQLKVGAELPMWPPYVVEARPIPTLCLGPGGMSVMQRDPPFTLVWWNFTERGRNPLLNMLGNHERWPHHHKGYVDLGILIPVDRFLPTFLGTARALLEDVQRYHSTVVRSLSGGAGPRLKHRDPASRNYTRLEEYKVYQRRLTHYNDWLEHVGIPDRIEPDPRVLATLAAYKLNPAGGAAA